MSFEYNPAPDDDDDPARPDRERLISTVRLFQRIRRGDTSAREILIRRYFPALRAWAHGRLPKRCRDLEDTDDIVQKALERALSHLHTFDPVRRGAFLAYLRQIVRNAIIDAVRRASARAEHVELRPDQVDVRVDPTRETHDREFQERYLAAMTTMSSRHQEALFLRIEMDAGYEEIGVALGLPSQHAARMVVRRAAMALMKRLQENDGDSKR